MDGIVYRTAKQSKTDPTEFVLSDESVDRMGDIIMASGWDLANFKNNPIALFNHRPDSIVGKWENVRVEGKRLVGKLRFAQVGTSKLIDEVRSLFEQGFLKAVSVGFKPLKAEPINKDDEDDWFAPQRFLQQELVECSIVAVPANPNALQVSRSLPMPTDVVDKLFGGKIAAKDNQLPVVVSPPPARSPSPPLQKGVTPMSLAQKIEAAKAERVRLKDLLTGLVGKDEMTEAEEEQVTELNASIPKLEGRIATLESAEKALAVQVIERSDDPNNVQITPPSPSGSPRPFAMPIKKMEPLDYILRAAVVTGIAYHKGQPQEKVLRDLYRGDEATAILLQKGIVNPAMTSVVGWAAELVQTVTDGFLDTLKPISVYARLRALGLPLNFGAGIIKVPGRSPTPMINGDFVGEGAPIPVRRIGTTGVTLTPKKVAVISTFTEEMSDYSAPQIEGLLREAIVEDTAVVLDSKLLDAIAASAIRPAGLRNGIAALPPSAASDPTQAMVADFKALIGALTAGNGGRKIAIIMNTAQSWGLSFAQTVSGDFLFGSAEEASRKFGVSFIVSNTVPPGVVIAVDAADFVSVAGDAPNFDMSNQATIHEEDTTPLPIVDAAGVAAKPIRSLWQTDSIGLRMRMPVNWAMRRPNMVAWTEAVAW